LLLALMVTGLSLPGAAQNTSSKTDDPVETIRRGNGQYKIGEYQAAIEEYRRVSPGAGKAYAQSLYNIGVCYYELAERSAIAFYRQAISEQQGHYPAALYAWVSRLKS
jgi:tetratricopeptide (TPR) repeat protein